MEFSMKIDGMEELGAMLDKRVARMAVVSGTNHTAGKVKTAGSKAVREIYNVKAKDIKDMLSIVKATMSKPYALFKVWGYRMGVAKFGARQIRSGVTFKIKKGGGRKKIGGAFMATMQSGHKGAWRRSGAKMEMSRGRYKGKMRQPIVERFTIAVPEMFGTRKVVKAMQGVIDRDLAERVWRDYERRIDRASARR